MSEEVWVTATGELKLIIWYSDSLGSKELNTNVNSLVRDLLLQFGGESLGDL